MSPLTNIVKTYIGTLTEPTPVKLLVANLVATHPQYSAAEVQAALTHAVSPPDTAEGYFKHAEELERYARAAGNA